MSAFQIFYDDRYCEACKGHWRATVRVQHQGPRAKRTEVEVQVVLVTVWHYVGVASH